MAFLSGGSGTLMESATPQGCFVAQSRRLVYIIEVRVGGNSAFGYLNAGGRSWDSTGNVGMT